MIITLTPQRRDDTLSISRAGDALTINGQVFDFSGLADGASYPAEDTGCVWFAAPIERVAGELRIALILPHGAAPSEAVAFPAAITNPPDGLITLPHDEVDHAVDA